MKKHQLGTALEVLGNCLCLPSTCCSLGITFASIWGIIETTSNMSFWQSAFFAMYLVIISSSLICTGEYIFIKSAHSSTLLNVFGDKTLSNVKKAERILHHIGIAFLSLTCVFNLFFARTIWNGDGHGLAGTWLATAGGTPIIISFIAMIPVCIQRGVWKLLLKKTGKWDYGPYE